MEYSMVNDTESNLPSSHVTPGQPAKSPKSIFDQAIAVETGSTMESTSPVGVGKQSSELTNYFGGAYPCTENQNDPLGWWKVHQTQFPVLSQIATKHTLSDSRSSMTAITASKTVITKEWLRKGLETGEILLDFDDHQDTVGIVAYSPSGVKIASGSYDHTIRVRNAHTGERLTQPLLHADAVYFIVWSPDSRQLISACNNGQICFWSAPTGTQLGSPLQAHLSPINCVAISHSGSLLASASNDHTARLWNTVTRQPFGRVLQHNDRVYTVAFSPGGHFVATGGREGIIFLWDISQEGVIATSAVSVSLLHAAPIPHFAGDADQPRSSSDSLAGSPRPSIPASDVPFDGAQGMSSLPITPAGLVDSEVPPISLSSTLTRDALQGAGRVASPHGTVPVPAPPSSPSFFKRLFSKSDMHVASPEHSKPRKPTFFNKLM
ncbi:hypothetical protein PAXINDRAFT_102278 [Paxillus involutus ATCC 200175]|uniref:WD40 repeat-like protein n=1 Tax=Paxillus involutus ATCC 200175 TaxID=664439 RepID=A0A0C9TEC9_PAXIN|nr:hypothetical protein PAXINDRAFT_102278 [Paxillus involutus ATCC 200175]